MENIYTTKIPRLRGRDYHAIVSQARVLYLSLKKRTKRRPYLRSAYFNKEKIFIDGFWQHIWQKNWRDRYRRFRYLPCAIDLIQHTTCAPHMKENLNKSNEIFYRFSGMTPTGELFYVQIKEDKKTGQKTFMSVFQKN